MKVEIEIEIPDPSFELAANEKLECRGLGWKSDKAVRYTFWCLQDKVWHGKPWEPLAFPGGNSRYVYFEIVEVFPMPPEELCGFKLTYGGKAYDCQSMLGKRYAFLKQDNRWEMSPNPLTINSPFYQKNCHVAFTESINDLDPKKKNSTREIELEKQIEGFKKAFDIYEKRIIELQKRLTQKK